MTFAFGMGMFFYNMFCVLIALLVIYYVIIILNDRRDMKDISLPYVAGFFDGEGCITFSRD